ncbi:MAG: hypothetical protein JWM85_2504 [Acidimicrobiaceae bacterium]|nr:hypothetical protein [Acidimicrobiaceae bacterium]
MEKGAAVALTMAVRVRDGREGFRAILAQQEEGHRFRGFDDGSSSNELHAGETILYFVPDGDDSAPPAHP